MQTEAQRLPLLRIMAGNAFVMSLLYLVLGVTVEVLRRVWPTRFILQLSKTLDLLPAGVLQRVGALEPLREAYFSGQLTEPWVRLVFASTTLLFIFSTAAAMALMLGLLRLVMGRRAPQA